jgi:hypothetical protein
MLIRPPMLREFFLVNYQMSIFLSRAKSKLNDWQIG